MHGGNGRCGFLGQQDSNGEQLFKFMADILFFLSVLKVPYSASFSFTLYCETDLKVFFQCVSKRSVPRADVMKWFPPSPGSAPSFFV